MRLGVNIDHVATLREARQTIEPDPVYAALACEVGGADVITCHLREDRRHIKDRDVDLLKKVIKIPLNLECSADFEMVKLAVTFSPQQVTLVPERREEITTEGGLDVKLRLKEVTEMVKFLKSHKIKVALFVDADKNQLDAASKTFADAVEIHTGNYSLATGDLQIEELIKIEEAAMFIHKRDMKVHAGHGLNYSNTAAVAAINFVDELNIGHAIVSRAIFIGMEKAVRDMKEIIHRARLEG